MKKLTLYLFLSAAMGVLLALVWTHTAQAQINTEKSLFVLTEPVEFSGTVLQPGTYLIKVVELSYNRDIVQVTNEDQTKVFATALATPHLLKMDEIIPESRFVYYPSVAGQPKVLRTWFAAATPTGQDLIYPKRRAMDLAAEAKQPVLAVADDVKEADYKSAPVSVVTADQTVKPYEDSVQEHVAPPPPPVAVAEIAAPPPPAMDEARATTAELPQTASRMPLYAVLGLISLAGAFSLRVIANRAA